MKTRRNLLALVIPALVAGILVLRAQQTSTSAQTSIIPQSPAQLRSIESYSDAQLEQLLNVLAATPLIWPANLPNNGNGGTYWSLAHPEWPPLPATFGTPVWDLTPYSGSTMSASTTSADSTTTTGSGFYLLDDVDYPPMPGDGGGTNSEGGYSGDYQPLAFTTNDLWLQIIGTTNTGASMTAYLIIHPPWNVTNGVYDLFATTNLAPSAWQWVLRTVPGQTNLTVTGLSSPMEFFILGLTNDADGDGLTDAYELLVSHTNPNLYSTDGSGMSDGWEWQYFGSISNNPNADPDGDGLTTFQEWQMRSAGYNPVNWNSFTNSVVGDGYQDYSGDGLANLMEAAFGGNLLTNNPAWKADADGDGLPDLYETMAGSGAVGLPAYSKNPIP
jgi:hypothetical protein